MAPRRATLESEYCCMPFMTVVMKNKTLDKNYQAFFYTVICANEDIFI